MCRVCVCEGSTAVLTLAVVFGSHNRQAKPGVCGRWLFYLGVVALLCVVHVHGIHACTVLHLWLLNQAHIVHVCVYYPTV